jgi:hypothetical protein
MRALSALRNAGGRGFRTLTRSRRALPDFLIIGASRSGTTALFYDLIHHPGVKRPVRKEIHFFDRNFDRGVDWYRSHFPLRRQMSHGGHSFLTGEATPYYLAHPLAPARVRRLLPDVRMLVLLRNPIDRAYSSYQQWKREGVETEPFERAIALEPGRMDGEVERLVNEPGYSSFNHYHHGYLTRSVYWRDLERWFSQFPREQFCVLDTAALRNDPATAWAEALGFIGLPQWAPATFTVRNSGGAYEAMAPAVRTQLVEYFRPHNERLFELLGRRFDW